jgi:hypothetical protein
MINAIKLKKICLCLHWQLLLGYIEIVKLSSENYSEGCERSQKDFTFHSMPFCTFGVPLPPFFIIQKFKHIENYFLVVACVCVCLCMCVWQGLNSGQVLIKQALYHLSHFSSPFCSGYFGDGVLQTPRWPQTAILPISASQVARITGVSHQHLAKHMESFKNCTVNTNNLLLRCYN